MLETTLCRNANGEFLKIGSSGIGKHASLDYSGALNEDSLRRTASYDASKFCVSYVSSSE